MTGNDVAGLFREVISCCLNLEQPLTVAYFGPAGTYTEAAAVKQFGHFANTQPMASMMKCSEKWNPKRCITALCQ
ncbi:MAG: hypothetical protein CM15mP120_12990 [Pseudomonadota bacterium]|nr:MAG: hypothetical protein CM15mP120_12990 [Pseudomonadota bacterium]